jgi:hypothetical protein
MTHSTHDTWHIESTSNPNHPVVIVSDGLHGLDPLTGRNPVAIIAASHVHEAPMLLAARQMFAAGVNVLSLARTQGVTDDEWDAAIEMLDRALSAADPEAGTPKATVAKLGFGTLTTPGANR